MIRITALLLLLSISAIGQKENSLIRKGNGNYDQKDYKEAEKNYRKALEINSESQKAKFNLGAAVYQGGDFGEAARVYSGMAELKTDAASKAKVFHNLGNSLLQSKEYEKSILAYKNALMNDPKNLDTKYNLEYARMMLRKQQQEQQNQQNKDNQDNKDKQEEQKKQEDQQNQQNQQKQDQNKDPEQRKISKEDAARMLEALKNDEKKTQQKVKKQQMKVQVVGVEKDW
jgi:tetratricopeptide (TPR) repeat protein